MLFINIFSRFSGLFFFIIHQLQPVIITHTYVLTCKLEVLGLQLKMFSFSANGDYCMLIYRFVDHMHENMNIECGADWTYIG